MSFEAEFLTMMPHVLTVHHFIGETFEGENTFDPVAKYYRCRISGKALSLRRQQSEDDTVIFDIWLDPTPIGGGALGLFKQEDRVILPDDQAWVDTTPIIFAVGRLTDDEGHHHVKLQCGWMYHRQGQ